MRKITAVFKSLFLATFLLLMTNCATEEISRQNVSSSSNDAKIWFDANKNNYSATVLKYVKDFKWEDAIISDGDIGKVIEIPFTFENNLSTTNKNADLYNDHHRLMFVKDANNGFKLSYVQIFTSDKESKNLDQNYNYYSIKDDFDGKVFVQELATKAVSKLEFNNGKKIERLLTAKQREAEITCVEIGYWYEDGHFESIDVLYCEGGGPTGEPGTGGYGGGGTTPQAPTPTCPEGYAYSAGECKLLPPSCKSFNFTAKKGANWQVALVKNINFRVILITPPNSIKIQHVIDFPQAVEFGVGIDFNKGSNVTPGAAATVSAMVLQIAMDETVAKYGKTDASELTVRLYFQEALIREYREYLNGGTVNFNSTSTLTPTQYRTNASDTGICD